MLQRAASNAYSWWWASHIRTKQSKWLDNDIEEMEERVKSMLKIIEQDGDSFAKKAEIYFKKRPELVNFVEETYKAYRALAEKYDHISGELHKANHTIATAFPDQIQFDAQDDDDDSLPETITSIDPSKIRKSSADIAQIALTNRRRDNQPTLKKSRLARTSSQGSKEKAQEEIDRLQKGILVLQTEKEFIKSSYEEGMSKYWEIEKQISEMQEEVFLLQDGYNTSVVIEDDEARTIMATTALKSCEDALNSLHEQQKKSIAEAKVETEKIKIAKEKLIAGDQDNATRNMDEEASVQMEENLEPQSLHAEVSSDTSVVDLAEKINELVSKVISLEVTTLSQTAQMKSMKMEADELRKNLHIFEDEKKVLIDDSNILRDRLNKAEELLRARNLEECIPCTKISGDDDISVEASSSIGDITEELMSPKLQDQVNVASTSQESETPLENKESEFEEKETSGESEEKETSGGLQPTTQQQQQLGHFFDPSSILLMSFAPGVQPSLSPLSSSASQHRDVVGSPTKSSSEENSTTTSHIVGDISRVGISQEEVDSLNKTETPKDSGSAKANVQVDGASSSVCYQIQDGLIAVVLKQEDDAPSSHVDDNIHPRNNEDARVEEDEVSLVNGKEEKENILAEYTLVLRNYKETKKRLSEVEKKNQDYVHETTERISQLESANVTKDETIQALQKTLRSLQSVSNEDANTPLIQAEAGSTLQRSKGREAKSRRVSFDVACEAPPVDKDKHRFVHHQHSASVVEDRFRRDIDTLLEENLEFWLRFSTTFQNIQKFQKTFEDLQAEVEKRKVNKSEEGSSHSSSRKKANPESIKIEKQLKDLKTELQVWLEQNKMMQEELQTRFSSLGFLQEEISGALELSLQEDRLQFAPYQAAKFQGELLNIQMENNKVSDEMQAGLDHVGGMHAEVEKILSVLHGKSVLPESAKSHQQNLRHAPTSNKVPLGSFLFTGKPKKKQSIFRINPAVRK